MAMNKGMVIFLSCAMVLAAPLDQAAPADAAGIEFFEKSIRPTLVESCYSCHSADAKKVKGGLLLDTKDGLAKGGDNGAVVVPGDPERSRLVEAVRYGNPDLQMPPRGKKLSAKQIEDLAAWVAMGAPDPRVGAGSKTKSVIDVAAGRRFWSLQPVKDRAPPQLKDSGWCRSDL